MTEAEKAYQYFVIAVPENEEQAKAYFWARKALQPTLTPPNEWVSRLLELDELYTKVRIVTGFTVEQLLEMFTAGYTLEKPDYSKASEEMASLAETAPPNELPTCYQPDGDGCAYQCYDGDDEPIDKCKECPLCYSDKQRHHTPPNEWVSVEERLPEEKQRVIVRCECVGTSVGWILWGNWMTDIGPGAGKVTHWMPLPEPPDRRPPEGENYDGEF